MIQQNIVKIIKDDSRGKTVFVEGQEVLFSVQWAPLPEGPFEYTFKPLPHAHEDNSSIHVDGHKYIRFKVGENEWSESALFIGKDGASYSISRYENVIMYQKDGEGAAVLFDLSEIQGEQGLKGDQGYGMMVSKSMFYNQLALEPCSCTAPVPCNSCDQSTPSTSEKPLKLILILGDNDAHTLALADLGSYFKVSSADTTWTQVDPSHYGLKVRFYNYDNVNAGTIIDAQSEDTLGYRFTIWTCQNDVWHNLGNFIPETNTLAPTLADKDTAMYMTEYITNSETVELTPGAQLEVRDESIGASKLLDGTFTFGFDEANPSTEIKVKVVDFSGFGLKPFTSDSGEIKQEIDTDVMAGDGLQSEQVTPVDGADSKQFAIKVEDIIHVGSGLKAVTKEDVDLINRDNLEIQALLPMQVNQSTGNLEVIADELSLSALNDSAGSLKLMILEPAAGETLIGVLAKHINREALDYEQGLDKSDPAGKIYLKKDNNIFEFTASPDFELSLKDKGVQIIKLADQLGTAGEGIAVAAGKITALVDDVHIKIVGNVLTVDWTTIPASTLVKSIVVSNDTGDTSPLKDAITLALKAGMYTTTEHGAVGNTITQKVNVDIDALATALIDDKGFITSIGAIYWGVLPLSSGDPLTIQAAIDASIALALEDYVKLGEVYGSGKVQINDTVGLQMTSPDNIIHSLSVRDNATLSVV